jgi:serine/threonine-protein kinase
VDQTDGLTERRPLLHGITWLGVQTLVGTLLDGRYRLDQQIGAGGMSTVYRAFDQRLERQVAIKVLHVGTAPDERLLERFRREARAVALLSHPHVVTVIDAGESDSEPPQPYIVFEYVEGETLKQRIGRCGALPISEAVAYAIEIARALGAAHAGHIVHRDVKPQNVLIDEEGRAKVTDFGIARSLDEGQITVSGRVLGTTDYVSPEQALGHQVTGQSDIYSLGIVLYEMLTGEVPFSADSQVAVAMKHIREAVPDVQVRRPEVSATLAAVLDRATAMDLSERYSEPAALVSDLEEALALEASRSGSASGEATSVLRTLPRSSSRRVPLRLRRPGALLALLIVAAAVVAAVLIGAAGQTHHGTGVISSPKPQAHNAPVRLGQEAASDFDPLGDDHEHSDETSAVVDRNPGTAWSTEHYSGGLAAVKPGVGIYVDAKPGVPADALEIVTDEPGFQATLYAAPGPGPAPTSLSGWKQVAANRTIDSGHKRIDIHNGGQSYRYYLVWITHFAPGADQASIAEIQLYRRVSGKSG